MREQTKPLAIDLYCGLGGWTEGLLAEGFDVVGFDVERHDYGTGGYPAQLVLQDCLTIHGAKFRDAALIVASPPCQEFSYRAMPWKRAKALGPPVLGINLFSQCARIQHEASEAAGHHIPMVVENVKGAQPWVGRAAWHYGSFYLWGDVPALMPSAKALKGRSNFHFYEQTGLPSPSFHGAEHEPSVQRHQAIKNNGGSWFAIGSPGQTNVGQNPDGRKVPGMNGWDGYGKPGYKPQGFNVTAAQRYRQEQEGVKQEGSGEAWFDNGLCRKSRQVRLPQSRLRTDRQDSTAALPMDCEVLQALKTTPE